MIIYIITRLLKEKIAKLHVILDGTKFAQIYFKWKQNKNLPRFGHVFDFDHFTKGALTQGGLHSIWKMTKTTKTMSSELREKFTTKTNDSTFEKIFLDFSNRFEHFWSVPIL
jgi:hypothetical protein